MAHLQPTRVSPMVELIPNCQCRECREIEAMDRVVFQALRSAEMQAALDLAKSMLRPMRPARYVAPGVPRFPVELTRAPR